VFVRPAALSNYRRTHSERLGQFFDFDERTLHRRFISCADGRQPLIHRHPPLRVPSRVVFGPHGNRRELVDPPCQYLGFGPSAPVLWHKRSAAFSAASKAAQRRDFPCNQLLSSQLSKEQQTQRNHGSNRGRSNGFYAHVRSPCPCPGAIARHVNVSQARLLQYSFGQPAERPAPTATLIDRQDSRLMDSTGQIPPRLLH
jgi:hypothetical protein